MTVSEIYSIIMTKVTKLRIVRNDAITDPDIEVAIIGAGISGVGMAIYLKKAGIEDFTIGQVGLGTPWWRQLLPIS
ncbi:MAG: hypothetical protein HKL80_08395 [Acidimicrobiales bacterium]|nr:hypothetical protein [Acidimicrobiales bacterium]